MEELNRKMRSVAAGIQELRAYLTPLARDNGITKVFEEVAKVGTDQPATASRVEANRRKNRYANIVAYDSSRVRLSGGPSPSDYINASWVPGANSRKEFIATQGPVPPSFADFWWMMWQTKSSIIVKVTREVERGVLKCHRYWPDPTSKPAAKTMELGPLIVTHKSTKPTQHFIVRTFELSHKDGSEPPRTIKQFSYETWPDHGVPLTTAEFLTFHQAVRAAQAECADPTAPVVIHCSAGVGRTGTYIMIDRLLHKAESGKVVVKINMELKELRMARMYMVQTDVQYFFIYRAYLDGLRAIMHDLSRKLTEETLAQELRDAVAREEQAKKEEAEREASEVKEMMAAAPAASAENQAPAAEEVAAASQAWDERNKEGAQDSYDIAYNLTTVESRLEALGAMGIKFTPAQQAKNREIVEAAKALRQKQAAEAEAAAKKEAEEAEKERAAAKKQAADAEHKEAKSAAQAKAKAFLRKMSAPNLN